MARAGIHSRLTYFSVQLFHALLQRFPILAQQRNRLNVAALVASRFEIVNVPAELLRQRIDLIRGRPPFALLPSVPWHHLRQSTCQLHSCQAFRTTTFPHCVSWKEWICFDAVRKLPNW
jgi:hypothetical protein